MAGRSATSMTAETDELVPEVVTERRGTVRMLRERTRLAGLSAAQIRAAMGRLRERRLVRGAVVPGRDDVGGSPMHSTDAAVRRRPSGSRRHGRCGRRRQCCAVLPTLRSRVGARVSGARASVRENDERTAQRRGRLLDDMALRQDTVPGASASKAREGVAPQTESRTHRGRGSSPGACTSRRERVS